MVAPSQRWPILQNFYRTMDISDIFNNKKVTQLIFYILQ